LAGVVVALLALVWSLVAFFDGRTVPGWTSLLATLGFVGAVQLLCLGLLGEYVARMFIASQGRPPYVVGYDSRRGEGAA
jgi:dolichol-phosphate mannosyltransferase